MHHISPEFVPSRSAACETSLALASPEISGKQRQILRLMDGRRTLAQIAVMMPGRDLSAEVIELRQQGWIAEVASEPPSAVALPRSESMPEAWLEASVYMKMHAREALGLMAQPVIQILDKVRDTASARSAVARWHMALRESRNARDAADEHLQHITRLLEL